MTNAERAEVWVRKSTGAHNSVLVASLTRLLDEVELVARCSEAAMIDMYRVNRTPQLLEQLAKLRGEGANQT